MFLHQLESGVAYLGVFTKIRQVVADDRQVAFLWINPFHLTYFLYRTYVQRIATDGVYRVGRINDKILTNILAVDNVSVLVCIFL